MRLLDADIVVTDQSGTVALIEVKNARALDQGVALGMFAEAAIQFAKDGVRFLMVTSQEMAFLWKLSPDLPLANSPSWQISMKDILEHYSDEIQKGVWLRHDYLEVLIWTWLGDLTDTQVSADVPNDSPFITSGFLDVLKSSSVALFHASE